MDKVKACEQAYRILDDVTVGTELPSLPISAATANDPPRKKKNQRQRQQAECECISKHTEGNIFNLNPFAVTTTLGTGASQQWDPLLGMRV